jgi:hypothetical protein
MADESYPAWQPIETAPTWQPAEGENISLGAPEVLLGWAGAPWPHPGYWCPDRQGGGRWDICGGNHYSTPPTHWMPLPPSPTTDGSTSNG